MGTCFRNAYDDSIIKFSIIIPVYNVEKFLRECLNSITSQTLKNFEVICIDDGSTDNSLTILQEYANKDSRFKVISQENQGQGIARNKAIDIASGEYLFFVDPDDYELFMEKIKWNLSIFEKIFSLKNQKINGIKYKFLTILGIKFVISKQKVVAK